MHAILAIHQLLSVIEGRLRALARPHGFRSEDLAVMGLVYANSIAANAGAINASLLAERVGRSRQSVHLTLARLARAGLVECWKHDNGWVGGWDPTEKGMRAWGRLLERLEELECVVFKSEDERRAAVEFVACVRSGVVRGTWLLGRARFERQPVRELNELRPGRVLSAAARRELLADVEVVEEENELVEGEREELVRLRREVEHLRAERLSSFVVR